MFDKNDTAYAQTIFKMLTSRVNLTGKEYNCDSQANPMIGYYYHFSVAFNHLGLTTATASGDTKGCTVSIAYVGGFTEKYYAISPDSQPSFWDELHNILGTPNVQSA